MRTAFSSRTNQELVDIVMHGAYDNLNHHAILRELAERLQITIERANKKEVKGGTEYNG